LAEKTLQKSSGAKRASSLVKID
jgi:hypothetical protein